MAAEQKSRHDQIIDVITAEGFVTIDDIAKRFGVTPQTIRRDINELAAEGLLRRYHGGAGLPSSVENVAYASRKVAQAEAKDRIARLVAQTIPDGASAFINIGTTTEAVARALAQERAQMRIITNNVNVVASLLPRTDFEVVVAGGLVRHRDGGIIGEAAIDFIDQFKVDFGIIGISGIDEDGSLLDFDYREVRVAQAIIRNSRRVFLVADHSKFGRSAMVRLGGLEEISDLFTDQPPPEKIRRLMDAAGIRIHIAVS